MQSSPVTCTFTPLTRCLPWSMSVSLQHTPNMSMHIPRPTPTARSQRLPHPLVSPSPPLPHLRHRLNLRRPLLRRVRVFQVHIPLLNQVSSLETRLGTLYSRNMFHGWIAPLKYAILTVKSYSSFIPTDIAVTSIADMTQQALQSFDARLSRFEYADAAIPVRIVLLRSAPSAPSAMTVRSIVI